MVLKKLQNYLKEQSYDGILIRKRNNFSWITEGRHNHIVQSIPEGVADLVIMQDKVYVVTSKMEQRRVVEEEAINFPFVYDLLTDDWFNNLDKLLLEHFDHMRMLTDTPFAEWKMITNDLIQLRSTLEPDEISRYRKLAQTAAQTLEETARSIKPGMTEHEIAAALNSKITAQGIRGQVILVATDERIYRYRHPIPTDKKLDKQAMLVLCAEHGGLVANVTRFVHFGSVPESLKENAKHVAEIDSAMIAATKPGATLAQVLETGIKKYKEAGFPEDWKLLHQGGMTGYESREIIATPSSTELIRPNQVYAWNPSLPGVKSEDTVLVQDGETEILTHTGDWEYITVTTDKGEFLRPTILEV